MDPWGVRVRGREHSMQDSLNSQCVMPWGSMDGAMGSSSVLKFMWPTSFWMFTALAGAGEWRGDIASTMAGVSACDRAVPSLAVIILLDNLCEVNLLSAVILSLMDGLAKKYC